ncbi:MAG: carbonic anhydrase [Patescibacteria group bacterium]
MVEKHTCEAVVIHCIDFRFRKKLNEYLMSRFPEGYDLISVAGGIKRLVSDSIENNFILEQLKISHKLHEPKVIVLIQHEDCGAYGGSKSFGDFEKEKDFQASELNKAEAILKAQFSQKIEQYFVRVSGKITSL